MTDLADALMDLARLALRFGAVDRTAVYQLDGSTPESDTDHTVMLGWAACALAERCFPTLDLGLVAQFALVHDAPEAYAGDTPTLRIDVAGRAAKAAREAAAVAQIRAEFADRLPWVPDTIRLYEAQQLPEARYVRGLDKVLPKIVHLINAGLGLREMQIPRAELQGLFEHQVQELAGYVGEFTELMDLLAEFMHRILTLPDLDRAVESSADLAGSESR